MQSIIIISALPALQVVLAIFWLWTCGWIIKDGHHCHGIEYSDWSTSETWTVVSLLFIWTVTCFIAHTFLTWWVIVLTKQYVALMQ